MFQDCIFLPEETDHSFHMNLDLGKLVNKVNIHLLQLFFAFCKKVVTSFLHNIRKPTVSCMYYPGEQSQVQI